MKYESKDLQRKKGIIYILLSRIRKFLYLLTSSGLFDEKKLFFDDTLINNLVKIQCCLLSL